MTAFVNQWFAAVERKQSCLCVGIDPASTGQRNDLTLSSGAEKLEWTLRMVETVSPYAAAIKLNRNYFKDLSQDQLTLINKLVHDHGMVSIDDSKLADIGDTNDAGIYHAACEGFDSITYAPFPGNIAMTAQAAKSRQVGLIMLVLMSNPEFELIKNAQINGKKAYEFFAAEAQKNQVEGVVIGAPSPNNHIQISEIEKVASYLKDDQLVLVPGIGAQGGDLNPLMNIFRRRTIVNVGRSIIYGQDPAGTAAKYRDLTMNYQ